MHVSVQPSLYQNASATTRIHSDDVEVCIKNLCSCFGVPFDNSGQVRDIDIMAFGPITLTHW